MDGIQATVLLPGAPAGLQLLASSQLALPAPPVHVLVAALHAVAAAPAGVDVASTSGTPTAAKTAATAATAPTFRTIPRFMPALLFHRCPAHDEKASKLSAFVPPFARGLPCGCVRTTWFWDMVP